MELAIIGLGKMGLNMCKRLLRDKHTVHAYAPTTQKIAEAVAAGGVALARLEDVSKLRAPRTVWVMVPSGEPTRQVIEKLSALLSPGDLVIDGGNSYYKDSVERYNQLKARGLHFLDAGTSGGIWGLEVGYCLMVGGDTDVFARVEPIFRSLAPRDGYALVGGPGAGHFTKMVHNGIEYGLMQAYAEGFEILRASNPKLNLQQISHLWNQGSVVRSWLLELAERAFAKDPDLAEIQGYVPDSGEGRWTILAAMEHDVPAPVITLSLLTRFRSRQQDSFTAKVLAALRAQFGGHAVKTVAKT
jgi:6-phosphogluconate dehydrogenase